MKKVTSDRLANARINYMQPWMLLLALVGSLTTPLAGQCRTENSAPARQYRMAMSAAFVSQEGVGIYKQLAQWLSRKAGVQFEFIDGLGYVAINKMLDAGAVDTAFVCGLPYVLLKDKQHPSVELLVAPIPSSPRYQSKPKYFSDLIVRKDSRFRHLEDLRGKVYVYNEETSNSGYNMARYRLGTQGKAKGFFSKVLRSGSHEESIRMVASGMADASYVDSLVLDFERSIGLSDGASVRVIDSVGPAGIVPVVISLRVPADRRESLRKLLAHMHEDPEGRAILAAMLIKRFEPVDDSNYDDIRRMKAAAEKGGFTKIEAGGPANRK